MATLNDLYGAATARRDFLESQRSELRTRDDAFGQDVERLESALSQVRNDLKGHLLSDVDELHLRELEQRLSYPRLLVIKEKYDRLLDLAVKEREALEQTPEIAHHEFHLATVTDERAGIADAVNGLKRDLALWAENFWFERLNERGYFGLDYHPGLLDRFWDWRAVSALMPQIGYALGVRFETPQEVKDAYRRVRGQADMVFELDADLTGRIDKLTQLKDHYDQLVAAPDRLFQELYHELGDAILDHLDACTPELRLELVAGDRDLETFLKKLTGLEKQVAYLKELRVARIGAVAQTLDQQIGALGVKIEKVKAQLRRGKRKRVSGQAINKLREFKRDKWQKRMTNLDKARDRIVTFERYDHGSLASDFLWWALITKGMYGNDLYEVRVFTEQHPGWSLDQYLESQADLEPLSAPLVVDSVMDDTADTLTNEMLSGPDDQSLFDAS